MPEETPEETPTKETPKPKKKAAKKAAPKKADGSPAKPSTGVEKHTEPVRKFRMSCPEHATKVRALVPGTGFRYIKEGSPLTVELTNKQYQALVASCKNVDIEEVK